MDKERITHNTFVARIFQLCVINKALIAGISEPNVRGVKYSNLLGIMLYSLDLVASCSKCLVVHYLLSLVEFVIRVLHIFFS